MTAAQLLTQARADGVALGLDDGRLRAAFPADTRARWSDQLRKHKPELVALLQVEALVHRYCALLQEADPAEVERTIEIAQADADCAAWIEYRVAEMEATP